MDTRRPVRPIDTSRATVGVFVDPTWGAVELQQVAWMGVPDGQQRFAAVHATDRIGFNQVPFYRPCSEQVTGEQKRTHKGRKQEACYETRQRIKAARSRDIVN